MCDSLTKDLGYTGGIHDFNLLSHQESIDVQQKAKELEKIRVKPDPHVYDSLAQLQNQLDFQNTVQLLKMIESNGISVVDSLNNICHEDDIFLIFGHAPDIKKEEVRQMLEIAKKENGFNPNRQILWHLDGRPNSEKYFEN